MHSQKPFLIGVTGGTASGKTTLCAEVSAALNLIQPSTLLSMDHFYFGLSDEDHEDADNYNFDHPKSLDFKEMAKTLKALLRGEDASTPTYNFATHKRNGVI
jgi:uridine kinase